MNLSATCFETNWFLSIEVDDSAVNTGGETTTHYSGSRIVRPGESFFLLGSFTRRSVERSRDGVPVLSALPLVGKVFQRSNTNTVNRNVMIIAKPVDVSSVIQSSVAGGAGAGPAQLGGGHDVPANIGRDFPLDADRWDIPYGVK